MFKNLLVFFKFRLSPLLFLLLFASFFYARNLTNDIYGGDSGDLVTAAFVGGIAHPPGYPLHTLLGFISSHLLIFIPVVSSVALISAIASLISLLFFYKLSFKLTKSTYFSIVSTATLAFSFLFWFYSEIAEVFSLNTMFAILLLYLGVSFYKNKKVKILMLASFIFGLSLTNHHTIILISPVLLLLFFGAFRIIIKQKRVLFYLLISFLLGFSVYLYAPIAAFRVPVINWDNPVNLGNLINLILRKGYGTFQAGNFPSVSSVERIVILKIFLSEVVSSISLPAFIISLLGILYALKKERTVAVSFIFAFIITGPLFISYAGFPLWNIFILSVSERFYILPSVILLLFMPLGLLLIKNLLTNSFSQKVYSMLVLAMFIFIPVLLFIKNNESTNLSNINIGNKLGENILTSAPQGAALIIAGDTAIFNTWYAYYVNNFRPDIELIQASGLANNYYLDKEVEEYKKKHNILKEPSMEELILEISKKRPVFSLLRIDLKRDEYKWVPAGMGYILLKVEDIPSKNGYISKNNSLWEKLDPPKKDSLKGPERNLIYLDIVSKYADSKSRIALFLYQHYKDSAAALLYLNEAEKIDKDAHAHYAARAIIEGAEFGNCSSAEKNILTAIEKSRLTRAYYSVLELIYKECYKDALKWDDYQNKFEEKYGISFSEAFVESSKSADLNNL